MILPGELATFVKIFCCIEEMIVVGTQCYVVCEVVGAGLQAAD